MVDEIFMNIELVNIGNVIIYLIIFLAATKRAQMSCSTWL